MICRVTQARTVRFSSGVWRMPSWLCQMTASGAYNARTAAMSPAVIAANSRSATTRGSAALMSVRRLVGLAKRSLLSETRERVHVEEARFVRDTHIDRRILEGRERTAGRRTVHLDILGALICHVR